MNGTKVPLVTVAAELGEDVTRLARRLDGQVVIDEVTGLRAVPADVCRRLLDEEAARQARQREQAAARREEMAERSAATRDRIRAIKARQAQLGIAADDGDLSTAALANIAIADTQARLDAAGRRFEEMKNANNAGQAGSGAMFRQEVD